MRCSAELSKVIAEIIFIDELPPKWYHLLIATKEWSWIGHKNIKLLGNPKRVAFLSHERRNR
jgi:hypothetical protein